MTSYYIYMLICSFSPSFTLLWPHIGHSGINYGHFSIRSLIIPALLSWQKRIKVVVYLYILFEFLNEALTTAILHMWKTMAVFHIAWAYQLIKTTTEIVSFALNSWHSLFPQTSRIVDWSGYVIGVPVLLLIRVTALLMFPENLQHKALFSFKW